MRIPIGKLLNYSLVLSIAVSVFFFIMISLHELDLALGGYRALTGGLLLLVTSFISIGLTRLFGRKQHIAQVTRSPGRYVLGWLATAVLIFLHQYILGLVGQTKLFPEEAYMTGYEMNDWQYLVVVLLSSSLVYSLVHILHNSVLLHHLRTESELEVARLRSINAETTNQLLRQQVQPHFLFNALNVLKSLIKTDSAEAERYLLHLSDFLRTSFTKDKSGRATVQEEIKLCRDYLEMQKMRFGNALDYRFEIPQAYVKSLLPVFSLQLLAENAIKHNELTEDNPLFIRVIGENGLVKVENNLQRKKTVENSTGNGLFNLSERYKALSGGQSLTITDDGETFVVSLKPVPYENRHH